MTRSAIAVLSTENLIHNAMLIRKQIGSAKIIAMVKANAYGHGIRSVCNRLSEHIELFGVASIDEAIILRENAIRNPIVLMQGVQDMHSLLIASVEGFHVVFHSATHLQYLERSNLPHNLSCWLKIDTGLGRLGFSLEEADSAYLKLYNHPKVNKPIGIMSHFACADDKHHASNVLQIKNFNSFAAGKRSSLSLCNSGGILNFPECHFDYVRPGILLYGISPIESTSGADYGFKPVMTLRSRFMSIKKVKKGLSVGYGAKYICEEDMLIGLVAFGYGDGYPFDIAKDMQVLVDDIECSIIGRVSMDMLAVDLRKYSNVTIDSTVILWGDGLSLEKISAKTTLSRWNLLTGIQNRVKFLWTK